MVIIPSADQHFNQVLKNESRLNQINAHLYSKIGKKPFKKVSQVRAAQQVRKFEKNRRQLVKSQNAPNRRLAQMLKVPSSSNTSSARGKSSQAIRFLNLIALNRYLRNGDLNQVPGSLTIDVRSSSRRETDADFFEDIYDVEKDKSKNLFKTISRRYQLIFSR